MAPSVAEFSHSASPGTTKLLRVGIIGCGEVAQVIHIPTLSRLCSKFRITYLCDVSDQALSHCKSLVQGSPPQTTKSPQKLCESPEVDVVLVASANPFHVPQGILALNAGKHVLIEKPVALSYRDLDALLEAEKKSNGRVFVGYMRRYAAAFLDVIKEVKGLDHIQYARVRDIIGPNATFVGQSATFPAKFDDYSKEDVDAMQKSEDEISEWALRNEYGVEVTPESKKMLRMLGGLGTHDLSAMREVLGMPKSVLGASLGSPGIWSALLSYGSFPVVYESGMNGVPVFDAHIEVYSATKIVRVNFDTPYIKGLPVTLTIRELIPGSEGLASNGYQERQIRKTYQDPYTAQMLEFWECCVNKKTIKTSAQDAKEDLDLIKMLLRAGENSYHNRQ